MYEFGLGLGVCVTVCAKFCSQLSLQDRIRVGVPRMTAQVISKNYVAIVFRAAGWAYIQMMRQIVSRSSKGFAAWYSQIALVFVLQRSQFTDDGNHVGA